MKQYPVIALLVLFLALPLLLLLSDVLAQTGGVYDLSWNTVDAGNVSSSSIYNLTGVIGQTDAGVLSGGIYSLNGGFLFRDINIYLPIILK